MVKNFWQVFLFSSLITVSYIGLPNAGAEIGPCGPKDPSCAKRLGSILNSVPANFNTISIDSGVHFGHDTDVGGAIRFSYKFLEADLALGDLDALVFQAMYDSAAGGFRVRFDIAKTSVLFFCKDQEGKTHFPTAGLIQAKGGGIPFIGYGSGIECRPDGIIGLGADLINIQVDQSRRTAIRWLEINAVLNMLGNGNSTPNDRPLDYLHHQLNLFMGMSLDTVFERNRLPGIVDDKSVAWRGNVGIMGMVRTQNNLVEVQGYFGYRPNMLDWTDYALEARAKLLFNFLITKKIAGTAGLDASFSYWTSPVDSIGDYSSDRFKESAYVGALFGLRFR